MAHYVIIGNGIAGVTAAETIRGRDIDAKITIISAEKDLFYYRPRVPDVIEGKVARDQIAVKKAEWYEQLRIEQRLGEQVAAVRPEQNELELENGEIVTFDKLLIATGAAPRKLPIKGVDLEGLVTLRGLRDAEEITKNLAGAKRAAVIGGGLLGVELARAFRGHGLEVDLINLLGWYWPEMLDEKGASIIEKKIAEHGITLCNNRNTVEIFPKNGTTKVGGLRFKDGKESAYDLVGMAVGVAPNIKFLEGSGIETDRGVIVNENLQSNYPNIYAAGDVSQAYDIVYEKHLVHTAWAIAKKQGEVAGINMAGEERKYLGGIPANTIRIYGVNVTSMGIATPQMMDQNDEAIAMSVPEKDIYKSYVLRDDKFIGATFITDNAEAQVAEVLILEGIDMSLIKDQFSNPEFSFTPYLQTNLKIVCPVCKVELKLKLGSKDGDILVCPVCSATLKLHDQGGILVPEEIIVSNSS